MPLIKNAAFTENQFVHVADDETLPQGNVIVSLKRWQTERADLITRNAPIGVRLNSDQSAEALAGDVHHFALIEIDFPKFRDGRGYSSARILRQRLAYTGEIRAVGDVLRDQWLFMKRCGVDSFEVRPGTRLEDFRSALTEQTVFYQRSSDHHRSVFERRHTACQALAAE